MLQQTIFAADSKPHPDPSIWFCHSFFAFPSSVSSVAVPVFFAAFQKIMLNHALWSMTFFKLCNVVCDILHYSLSICQAVNVKAVKAVLQKAARLAKRAVDRISQAGSRRKPEMLSISMPSNWSNRLTKMQWLQISKIIKRSPNPNVRPRPHSMIHLSPEDE